MRLNLAPGIGAALLAALLFGASTPMAKRLLGEGPSPWMMAALLYLGSGLGLYLTRRIRGSAAASLSRGEWAWLGGAVLAGGVVAPVMLMAGLTAMPASAAALLLNAEGVFTALLAWFVFQENFDRRVATGMVAIIAGAVAIGWPAGGRIEAATAWPSLAVLGACLGWAIDNNLTRKVALADATAIAMIKGLAAGATNLALALSIGSALPAPRIALISMLIGFLGYGASLSLFVVALRALGTARTGAYFSIAPFFGALLSIVMLGETVTPGIVTGSLLMAVGVVLHLTEHHEHEHTHDEIEHEHEHTHDGGDDDDHDHADEGGVPLGTRHVHVHRHVAVTHVHAHFPDAHHQHTHAPPHA
ncbi:MAG: DMT family transporter [Proteobacteria bacterium]|nr:DMT family transporter [Pseudomonadota bacterium]